MRSDGPSPDPPTCRSLSIWSSLVVVTCCRTARSASRSKSLQYDSRNKRWPASVATSPVFPGRPIEHTDGPDRANSRSFTKKPFYYWKINPQSLNPRLRPPLAPAPPPRLEDLSPPLRRAACRGSAPRHVLARAPAMAIGPEGEVEGAPKRPLLHRAACPRRSSRRARPTL